MKIISSYGVELRKQNIPIRQTLEIYRSAVRYLVEVYESVWEELVKIEESKKRFNAAEPVSYTHLKASRDHMARRQYFDLERNRRQRGDLYITTILDEEMKPDDPRLR